MQSSNNTRKTADLRMPVKKDGTQDKRYTAPQFCKQDGRKDQRTNATQTRK